MSRYLGILVAAALLAVAALGCEQAAGPDDSPLASMTAKTVGDDVQVSFSARVAYKYATLWVRPNGGEYAPIEIIFAGEAERFTFEPADFYAPGARVWYSVRIVYGTRDYALFDYLGRPGAEEAPTPAWSEALSYPLEGAEYSFQTSGVSDCDSVAITLDVTLADPLDITTGILSFAALPDSCMATPNGAADYTPEDLGGDIWRFVYRVPSTWFGGLEGGNTAIPWAFTFVAFVSGGDSYFDECAGWMDEPFCTSSGGGGGHGEDPPPNFGQ